MLRFYEGRARYDGGAFAEALAAFDEVIAADETLTNALYFGALAAYRLDDHDGAERRAVRFAAASAPAFADVLRNLPAETRGETAAIVQYLADRAWRDGRRDASRDLNHALACYRDSADAWNNYGFLCRETGRFQDAYDAYVHALEKEPDSPQLLNDAAVVLHLHLPSAENREKAKAMYLRAIERADQVAADPKATAPEKERAAKAKQDATLNLADLAKGTAAK